MPMLAPAAKKRYDAVMFRPRTIIALVFAVALFAPLCTHAATAAVPRDLFRAAERVEVSADVTGDLYAAGQTVILRGTVGGDVLAIGGDVTIAGDVRGDVRVAGDRILITGTVRGSITALGRTVTIDPSATIQKNATIIAIQEMMIAGPVVGFVRAFADAATVRSAVGGDVALRGNTIAFTTPAVIEGNVDVTSPTPPQRDDPVVVRGSFTHHPIVQSSARTDLSVILFRRLLTLFALLLVGLVLIHLFRAPVLAMVSAMVRMPAQSIAYGVAVVVVPPVIAALLMATLIGIPLGLMLLSFWATLLYASRVLFGIAVALLILERVDGKRRVRTLMIPLVTGAVIVVAVGSIPLVGPAITVVGSLWSLGSVALIARAVWGASVTVEEKKKV